MMVKETDKSADELQPEDPSEGEDSPEVIDRANVTNHFDLPVDFFAGLGVEDYEQIEEAVEEYFKQNEDVDEINVEVFFGIDDEVMVTRIRTPDMARLDGMPVEKMPDQIPEKFQKTTEQMREWFESYF